MVNVPRFFAGKIDGVQRVRLSKPGKDASSDNLRNRDVLFDTAWTSALTIHARGLVKPSTTKFSFPPLDYIPFVFIASNNSKSGAEQLWGKNYELEGASVSNSKVILPERDEWATVIVFRAPAFDTRDGTGYVDSGSVPRILIGQAKENLGGDYGIFISRKKYDVTECDEENLIFSSSRSLPNIYLTTNRTLGVGILGDGAIATGWKIGDWPGYVPLFMSYITTQKNNWRVYPPSRTLNNAGNNIDVESIKGQVSLSEKGGDMRLNVVLNDLPDSPPSILVSVAIFDVPLK